MSKTLPMRHVRMKPLYGWIQCSKAPDRSTLPSAALVPPDMIKLLGSTQSLVSMYWKVSSHQAAHIARKSEKQNGGAFLVIENTCIKVRMDFRHSPKNLTGLFSASGLRTADILSLVLIVFSSD